MTTTLDDGATPPTNVPERTPLFGLSALPVGGEFFFVVVVALYFVAYSTGFLMSTWSPRYGLLLLALPTGVACMGWLVTQRDRAALAASLFLLWCLISAVTSPAPLLAIKGTLGAHSFVIIYTAVLGVWAIGRSLSDRARTAVPIAVLIGLLPNVVLGVVQIVFEIDTGTLGSVGGRAAGFLGNAAYYGSAVVGAAAYCVARVIDSSSRRWVGALVVFSFGAAISGSRGAAGALVIVTVGLCIAYRSRRTLHAVAAIVAGNVLAALLPLISTGSSGSPVGRLASTSSTGRTQIWQYDLRAAAQRPVFGWGLGNHAAAVRQFYSEEFTRTAAWDDWAMTWKDPHNIVMLLLVSTGVVGVALISWFVFRCLANIEDRALLAMAAATALTWLLQPASIDSLPVAMLALGAASQRLVPTSDAFVTPFRSRQLAGGAIAVGALSCLAFLIPDARLDRALTSGDADASEAALDWVWHDPVATDATALLMTNQAIEDPAYVERALALSKRTTELDPSRPYFWTELARRQLVFGRYDESLASLERALDLERWNPSAWQLRVLYGVITGDLSMAEESRIVVCRLDLPTCATGTRWAPVDLDS